MTELSVIRATVAGLLLATGVLLLTLSVMARRGRLHRNRWFGVRTSATMRSPEAFGAANTVAAPATAVGGGLCVAAGVLTLLLDGLTLPVGVGVCVIGAGIITATGGVAGHRVALRSAEQVTGPRPTAECTPAGCASCTLTCRR